MSAYVVYQGVERRPARKTPHVPAGCGCGSKFPHWGCGKPLAPVGTTPAPSMPRRTR